MLSDRETLARIQSQLVTEDLQFTGHFTSSERHLALRGPRARHTAMTAALVVASCLGVLMIVVHAAGPAMFFSARPGG